MRRDPVRSVGLRRKAPRRPARVHVLCLFAAAIVGIAAPSAGEESRQLVADRAELTRLFAEQTFYGRYTNAHTWIEYYAADGRLGYWDGCPHAGRWWIERLGGNDAACFHYPKMVGANIFCFDVYRKDGRLEFLTAGSDPGWQAVAYTRAIRPGNPEGLSLTASGCQVSRRRPHGNHFHGTPKEENQG